MAKIATFWDVVYNILSSNRVKSFLWRTGMMCLAVIVSALLTNIDALTPYISPAFVMVLGLILGEISKAINSALQGK
jgi:Ca2+-dependent lipid-binding protein